MEEAAVECTGELPTEQIFMQLATTIANPGATFCACGLLYLENCRRLGLLCLNVRCFPGVEFPESLEQRRLVQSLRDPLSE